MEPNPYEQIIDLLEEVKQRPFSYLGPPNETGTPSIHSFLDGVHAACGTLGLRRASYASDTYEAIIAARGWQKSALRVWVEMRAQGRSEEEITQEMLDIEIDLWKHSQP